MTFLIAKNNIPSFDFCITVDDDVDIEAIKLLRLCGFPFYKHIFSLSMEHIQSIESRIRFQLTRLRKELGSVEQT